jgi:hypothetical protein
VSEEIEVPTAYKTAASDLAAAVNEFVVGQQAVEKEAMGFALAARDLLNEVTRPCLPLLEGGALALRGMGRAYGWVAERAAVAAGVVATATAVLKEGNDRDGAPTKEATEAALNAAFGIAESSSSEPPLAS